MNVSNVVAQSDRFFSVEFYITPGSVFGRSVL